MGGERKKEYIIWAWVHIEKAACISRPPPYVITRAMRNLQTRSFTWLIYLSLRDSRYCLYLCVGVNVCPESIVN